MCCNISNITVLTLLFVICFVHGVKFTTLRKYDKIFIGQQGDSVTSEILKMPSTISDDRQNGFETDVPIYPLDDITGTVIGVVDQHPTMCGGYYRYFLKGHMGYVASNECWSYSLRNNAWMGAPSMTINRQYAASVTIDDKYYILGGKDSDYAPISSTEMYNGNQWIQTGDIPWAVSSHCVAAINGTHVLVTGGDYVHDSKPLEPPQNCSGKSYILNIKDFTWKEVESFGKDLSRNWTIQCGHGCSRISGWNSNIIIVGAAVNNGNNKINGIVEQFDPIKEQWTKGPYLEHPLTGAALIQNSDVIYLIGGTSLDFSTISNKQQQQALNTIYQLRGSDGWLLLNETLKYARYSFSAIPFM